MPHLTNFGLFNKKLDFRDLQMIIKGSCKDFRIIEKSLRDPSMFCSNIVRDMQLKYTWSLSFFGGRFLNFIIYFWTWDSLELVKCGINMSGSISNSI
jgi:hypothetical protein